MPVLSASKLGADRGKDFAKKKRRVGKTAPDAANTTKTTISTKSLIMPQQKLNVTKGSEDDKNHHLGDLLEKLTHTNGSMRADSLTKLGQVFMRQPGLLFEHLQGLLPVFGECMSDEEPSVRTSLCTLLYAHLPSVMPSVISPFFEVFLQYILAALNNINPLIRDDSIHLLRIVVVLYPTLLSKQTLTLLVNLSALLSEKELFSQKSGSSNKNFHFPAQFVHCRLQYWYSIYEKITQTNTNATITDGDNDFMSIGTSLNTYQERLVEIGKQIEKKYKTRTKSAPLLDEEYQTDLCERNLLQLPNNIPLSNIQSLVLTIEIILKHTLPQNNATLAHALLTSQLTSPIRSSNVVNQPNNRTTPNNNNNNNNNITNLKTNSTFSKLTNQPKNNETIQLSGELITTQNDVHIQAIGIIQNPIAFDSFPNTRSAINDMLNLFSSNPVNNPQPNNLTVAQTVQSVSTDNYLALNNSTSTQQHQQPPEDLTLVHASQYNIKSSTAQNRQLFVTQLQPVLLSVLKSLLSCWDFYAPTEWTQRTQNDKDIYEHEDTKTVFGHKLTRSGPSQRHRGKLAKERENNQALKAAANTTPEIQLQHNYSLLVSIVASVYYLTHLDLQCRSSDFSQEINRSELIRNISINRLKNGKSLLLPFSNEQNDKLEKDSHGKSKFSLLNISALKFFPFKVDEAIFHSTIAELNMWTSKLISVLIPCIPAHLNHDDIRGILLSHQQNSLQTKFAELSHQYHHIKSQVVAYIAENNIQLTHDAIQSKADALERERLMAKYNKKGKNGENNNKNKTNKKQSNNMNDGNNNNNNNNNNNDDKYLLPDDLTQFEYTTKSTNPTSVNKKGKALKLAETVVSDADQQIQERLLANQRMQLFLSYKSIYTRYHHQLRAIQRFKTELSQSNIELSQQISVVLDQVKHSERTLYQYLVDSISMYGRTDQEYVNQHQLRMEKYLAGTGGTKKQNTITQKSNQTITKSPQTKASKRPRQSIVENTLTNNDHDDNEMSNNDEEDGEVELIHQSEDENDHVELDKTPLTLSGNTQFDSLLNDSDDENDDNQNLSKSHRKDDQIEHIPSDSVCALQFRDFLDLFWQVLPALHQTQRVDLVKSYTTFFTKLSTSPLSTTKVLALLPLLLLPELPHGGQLWHQIGLVDEWKATFNTLMKACLKVATLQRGAWLLSGPQGHRVLKLINWEFILTSISTSVLYTTLRFQYDNNTMGEPSNELISPPDNTQTLDSITSLILVSDHNNIEAIDSKPKGKKNSNSSSSGAIVPSVVKSPSLSKTFKFGPLLHALYWSCIQLSHGKIPTQSALPISISFYQSFISLLSTSLLDTTQNSPQNCLGKDTLNAISFIIATQLKFPTQSIKLVQSITGHDVNPVVGPIRPNEDGPNSPSNQTNQNQSTIVTYSSSPCGLSTTSTQYLQDTTLLHPNLTRLEKLSFLVDNLLSQKISLKSESAFIESDKTKPQNTQTVDIIALNDNQDIITNTILHILHLITLDDGNHGDSCEDFLFKQFLPMFEAIIANFYSVNIFKLIQTQPQLISITTLNATKIMQLLFLVYLYTIEKDELREFAKKLKTTLSDKFVIWCTILSYSLQYSNIIASINPGTPDQIDHGPENTSTTSQTTTAPLTKSSLSKSNPSPATASKSSTTTSSRSMQPNYMNYVEKFQSAKQSQVVKSRYYGINPALIPSLTRIIPYLSPFVYKQDGSRRDTQESAIINSLRSFSSSFGDFELFSSRLQAQFSTSSNTNGATISGNFGDKRDNIVTYNVTHNINLLGGSILLSSYAPEIFGLENLSEIENIGSIHKVDNQKELITILLRVIQTLIQKHTKNIPAEIRKIDNELNIIKNPHHEELCHSLVQSLLPQTNLDTLYSLTTTILSLYPIQNRIMSFVQAGDQSCPIMTIISQLCQYGAYTSASSYQPRNEALSVPIFSSFCHFLKHINSLMPQFELPLSDFDLDSY